MADLVPFIPSVNNYRLQVPMDNTVYVFSTRWNSRDQAWYFSMHAEDGSMILAGVKVVLGVSFGKLSTHAFFQTNLLSAVDTSGKDQEAGYDDLGARVVVVRVKVGSGGS